MIMGRKANNNKTTNLTTFSENVLSDLCCEIYQGQYILVLGDDVVLKPEYCGGSSKEYIMKEFKLENDENILTLPDVKGSLDTFLSENWEYNVEKEVSPELISLLSTKCFKVVLTTTFDQYIETVMRKIWGDELRIMNIYGESNLNIFSSTSEFNRIPPTLVYVFGKAGTKTDFVLTENDAIKVIHRWLSLKYDDPLYSLINYIQDKKQRRKVLAIGCRFEDWYFRFFWYSIHQNINDLDGDVAISLNTDNSESDKNLAKYFKSIRVENQGNSRQFLSELNRLLNDPDRNVYRKYLPLLKTGGIFISYASEDFPIVCQIYTALANAGFSVWFDNKDLSAGSTYDTRIATAISECRIFMPILSRQTKTDIGNSISRYYKDVEWEAVKDNKDCEIIPVTLFGFNINSDREILPEIFKSRTVFSWTENKADEICETLKKLMDKA